MNYTYTLNHFGPHSIEEVGDNIERLNAVTAPGLSWYRNNHDMDLIPDFMLPGSKLAGRWSKHDVESYGVTFEEFEKFVDEFGYDIVYNN